MSVGDSLQGMFTRVHAGLYERTRGWIGHRFAGVPSLLLRTTGRRTGRRRAVVLAYAPDGLDYLVVASNYGQDRPPAWYLNLVAEPTVELQVGRKRIPATARAVEASDAGHPRLWTIVNRANRDRYVDYQRGTSRPIAVVVLSPVGAPD